MNYKKELLLVNAEYYFLNNDLTISKINKIITSKCLLLVMVRSVISSVLDLVSEKIEWSYP